MIQDYRDSHLKNLTFGAYSKTSLNFLKNENL